MESDFSEMISLNMDQNYNLPIIGGLKILLDISSVKKKNKIIIEYNKIWYLESFMAYGYNTSNVNDIKNMEGITLDLIDEECDNNICKVSITKSSSDLKKVLFQVPKDRKKFKYIEFKHKKTNFFTTPDHPFFSCLLGLLLAIPNIIWFITRRIKRKMAATYCTFFMNLLLNMAYGALVGGLIGLGNEASYIIAMSFGGI